MGAGGHVPPKIRKQIFRAIIMINSGIFRAKVVQNSGIYLLIFRANIIKKLRYFGNFSGKNHVKFGHFVNFSYIFFGQKCLPPEVD